MADPEDRLAAYFNTTQPYLPLNDEHIDAIARLLARCTNATEKMASASPRTYIVLRVIGRLELLPRLLNEGFGDVWFPVTQRALPGFLDPRDKTSILHAQHLILTKSLDLENGQHCNYDLEEQRPFDVQSYIGSGSFGQVRIIESRVSYRRYALKTIRRRMVFGAQSREIMTKFDEEMKIMKRLDHRHIIRYIGSYTDRYDLGLVMSPVADCDLDDYLKEACTVSGRHPTLRTFFGCLATALSYLHDEGIKHRDIKPKNVLVHKANVLLADFGISREFLDTTSGPTTATQRYCAPEVAAYEGRNASADVWSLGCVFLEMQNALHYKDMAWLKAYYETHGTGSTHFYANPEATQELLQEWQAAADIAQRQPLPWMMHMLAFQRKNRPTAADMMNEITASDSQVGFMYSCDQCCYSPSDSEPVRALDHNTYCAPKYVPDLYEQQELSVAPLWITPMGPSRPSSMPIVPDKPVPVTDNDIQPFRENSPWFEASRAGAVYQDFDSFEPGKAPDMGTEGSDEQNTTAVSHTEQTSRHLQTSVNRFQANDLYNANDSFNEGPHNFIFGAQSVSFSGRVPSIVAHCASTILEAENRYFEDRLQSMSRQRFMTQERFNLLRNAFRENCLAESADLTSMEIREAPMLLCKYLEKIGVPIIPYDALREWPRVDRDQVKYPGIYGLPPLDVHCLAIFDLAWDRRDLLLYFLGYLASYLSIALLKSCTMKPETLIDLYGPFVCGEKYQERQVQDVLCLLIHEARSIFSCLGDGDFSTRKRVQLTKDIGARKQKEKRFEELQGSNWRI